MYCALITIKLYNYECNCGHFAMVWYFIVTACTTTFVQLNHPVHIKDFITNRLLSMVRQGEIFVWSYEKNYQ